MSNLDQTEAARKRVADVWERVARMYAPEQLRHLQGLADRIEREILPPAKSTETVRERDVIVRSVLKRVHGGRPVRKATPRAPRRPSAARVANGTTALTSKKSDGGGDPPPEPPPRARAVVACVTITDQTCDAVCGLQRRSWLRALDRLGVPHARVGARTVCTVAAWTAAIERASGQRPSAPALSDAEVIAIASGRGRR